MASWNDYNYINSVLQVLPVVLEIEKETLLSVTVYHMPRALGTFIDNFISLISEVPTQQRILIVADFSVDQMLPKHVAKDNRLFRNFNLSQQSQYSAHLHRGLLYVYIVSVCLYII